MNMVVMVMAMATLLMMTTMTIHEILQELL